MTPQAGPLYYEYSISSTKIYRSEPNEQGVIAVLVDESDKIILPREFIWLGNEETEFGNVIATYQKLFTDEMKHPPAKMVYSIRPLKAENSYMVSFVGM